ncbi:LysR family transcriptional regulator [Rhodococcus sp. ABRD24]|uniref:LysR substrate-binding domain-containing protein n=1 Tax=Rhodococcus sp. ABRD24 TaxID=2507582 RepID=UPI00103DE117|nr:LysR substrate-binding domain-containing protein [Rhodococcus sp. ABRD24]QBJ98242.1 LysR family transcriptional regulator [Rhodococcus sp. ABRD24]
MTEPTAPRPFRLAYVPGVTPTKWVRIWNERITDARLDLVALPAADAVGSLHADDTDAALLRLPIDREGLSIIPLYAETPVVVVPKDHVFTAADEISLADLADELVLDPLDTPIVWAALPGRPALDRPATTADAVELVAAGVGVLVVPQSLARLHHRKDLTYRPVAGAPESEVALAWAVERTTDLVEEFVGIVRGRTANSSRRRDQADVPKVSKVKAAKAKAAKIAAAKASGKATGPRHTGKPGGRRRRS